MTDAVITDTGMRGFLKWARREYPAPIYQKIAQGIQQRIPRAFSGYMLGGWRTTARRTGMADATTATVDTAEAANSTPGAQSWADMISQIIGTATAGYLDIRQQQQQQQVINTQLQQMQNGGAPRPISLSSSGITFGSAAAGMTAGGLLVVGVLGFLGLKALGVIK